MTQLAITSFKVAIDTSVTLYYIQKFDVNSWKRNNNNNKLRFYMTFET